MWDEPFSASGMGDERKFEGGMWDWIAWGRREAGSWLC